MPDRVRLRVRVAPSAETFEFLVPHCLNAGQAAFLMARLLRASTDQPYVIRDQARLMLLEGEHAGLLLSETTYVADLVGRGLVTDGSLVALV